MIPPFDDDGNLPPGIHEATWEELAERFGTNPHRKQLIRGLKAALTNLREAGCNIVYVDGSFVTSKKYPNDYDCLYESSDSVRYQLDPILVDATPSRAWKQKLKYRGEFIVSTAVESASHTPFLDFFQTDRETGRKKGIVKVNLEDFSR